MKTLKSTITRTVAVWTLAATTALAAEEDGPLGSGLMDVLDQGGVVMVIMLALSVIGFAFAFERLVSLRIGVLAPKTFIKDLRSALEKDDFEAAGKLVDARKGPLARMLSAGLKRRPFGAREMERAMESVGEKEIGRLRRPVQPLSVLAHIEPLLGLLGTILGMISTFNILHTTATSDRVETLAPGIGQALYTTAAGLCIAIPFVILYHYLMGRVNRIAEEWSQVGSDLALAANRVQGERAEAA